MRNSQSPMRKLFENIFANSYSLSDITSKGFKQGSRLELPLSFRGPIRRHCDANDQTSQTVYRAIDCGGRAILSYFFLPNCVRTKSIHEQAVRLSHRKES